MNLNLGEYRRFLERSMLLGQIDLHNRTTQTRQVKRAAERKAVKKLTRTIKRAH